MYHPMNDSGYPPQGSNPQGGYPPPGSYPQGGQPPPGAFPQGGYPPQGASPKDGFPPQGALPQGGYPPQGALLQGGYPPQAALPQGGYPPQGALPQGGYPPQAAMPQGGYPPQGPFPQGDKHQGYPSPGAYPPQPAFQPGYPSEGYGMPVNSTLGEDVDIKGFDFNEKSIRRAFIRKVYAILMTQLMVSLAFISVFTFHQPTKLWVMRNPVVVIVALVAMIVCIIAMSCCEGPRRKTPMNFIFLGVFTVAESLLLGVASSRYDSQAVMMAVGITAVICLALTIFAMQTRFDFTVIGGGLFCALVVLVLFGFIAIFIPKSTIMTLVYSSLGALLFSVYLIYDTQLMMGGNHKYTISPEEYVFAALNLYLDIINIFLFVLRIIGASKG